MSSRLVARFAAFLGCGVFFVVCSASILAQNSGGPPDAFISATPFVTWLGTSPKPQIPWYVEIVPPELTFYERMHLRILVKISGSQVRRHLPNAGLAFMYQVTDAAGRIYQDHTILEPQKLERTVDDYDLMEEENMLVIPGEYRLALALYDRKTGKYSFQEQHVTVPKPAGDPLPNCWPDNPSVYFFQPDDPGFNVLQRAPMALKLSLESDRPLRLKVMVNVNAPPDSAQFLGDYNRELLSSLGALATLTQLNVAGSSVTANVIDSVHRRVLLELPAASGLDWLILQSAVRSSDPDSIDVRALRDPWGEQAFLAQQLQRLVDSEVRSKASASDPLTVVILVSNPLRQGVDAPPAPPLHLPAPAGLLMYYISTGLPPPSGAHYSDEILNMLAPFNPHFFSARTATGVRAALADLLARISK